MNDTATISTADVIAGLLTENTGRHMLDSGGAYGRNWERNTGKTAADFAAEPGASWGYDADYAVVSLFHFLTARLEFDAELQAEFDDYCDERPDESWLTLAEEFPAERDPDSVQGVVNTYNHENCLSQDIQYVVVDPEGSDYIYGNEVYVLLQVHGGCDARGGYTEPKAFRVHGEVGLFDDNDVEFSCDGRDPAQVETLPGFPDATRQYHGWSYRGEWIDQDGSCCDEPEFVMNDDGNVPCPECGANVMPFALEG